MADRLEQRGRCEFLTDDRKVCGRPEVRAGARACRRCLERLARMLEAQAVAGPDATVSALMREWVWHARRRRRG